MTAAQRFWFKAVYFRTMRVLFYLLVGLIATCMAPCQLVQAQKPREEVVELQITPAFSPEDLGMLVQKLGKRGILLRIEETGYCNGQLRILKGEIIGSDGSRQGFETRALRQLNIQLEARTKSLGIRTVKVKSRLKKCREKAVDAPKKEDEADTVNSPPLRQI